MWDPTEKDFEAIRSWGLEEDPFAAVRDYSDLKKELRWLNPDHRELWEQYIYTRAAQIGSSNHEEYYRHAKKPIDKKRWEYLKARKAWYIMPLGWENFTKANCRVLDAGCGDGDTIQRVIEFTVKKWSQGGVTDRKLHLVGIDLNHSRIENAKRLVSSPTPNITFEFHALDVNQEGLPFKDLFFDYSMTTGVFEILEDGPALKFAKEIARVTKSGIYIEDLFDRFPGGYPRDLEPLLKEVGFRIVDKKVVLSEPFDIEKSKDPMRIWPVMVDQNVWAERVRSS